MLPRCAACLSTLLISLAGCGATRAEPASGPPPPPRPAAAAPPCDLYAAPSGARENPGTAERPLGTAQSLANRLRPGQTGCLRAGTYPGRGPSDYVVRFNHGGRQGKPLTLRSAPGERATLGGVVYVPRGSNHVVVSDLDVNDPTSFRAAHQITFQVTARHTVLERLDITNRGQKTCVILGDQGGYGIARHTLIRDSVLHDCGSTAHHMLDHAVYATNTRSARIVDNVIVNAAGYGIQLYSSAQNSVIRGNMIAQTGGGIIFGGQGDHVSSGNRVTRNVISGSARDYNLATYFPNLVGRGNTASDNCVSDGSPTGAEHSPGLRADSNLEAGPGFVDAAHRDFRLAPDSPCRAIVGTAPARVAVAAVSRR